MVTTMLPVWLWAYFLIPIWFPIRYLFNLLVLWYLFNFVRVNMMRIVLPTLLQWMPIQLPIRFEMLIPLPTRFEMEQCGNAIRTGVTIEICQYGWRCRYRCQHGWRWEQCGNAIRTGGTIEICQYGWRCRYRCRHGWRWEQCGNAIRTGAP